MVNKASSISPQRGDNNIEDNHAKKDQKENTRQYRVVTPGVTIGAKDGKPHEVGAEISLDPQEAKLAQDRGVQLVDVELEKKQKESAKQLSDTQGQPALVVEGGAIVGVSQGQQAHLDRQTHRGARPHSAEPNVTLPKNDSNPRDNQLG